MPVSPLIPAVLAEDTIQVYLPTVRNRTHIFYLCILSFIILSLLSLPLIYTDVSVKSSGLIRPSAERTEIKPIASGIIDTIYHKEGQLAKKNELIARLRNDNTHFKSIANAYELTLRRQFVHDLQLLTSMSSISPAIIPELQSPVYKQQVSRFIHQQIEQGADMQRINKELRMYNYLASQKAIASKELFDKRIESRRISAAVEAARNEQFSVWQQDLAKYELELSQLEIQQIQLKQESELYEVRAPITGVIQGINARYAGGMLQAGETFCIVSPETNLIAECYISTKDIGLLKQGQKAKFQIDAFDYNYFGTLTGKIISIDNDFTLMDNQPVFKVRCLLDSNHLQLKNGYTAKLKKGLTCQARFVIARRSLWQLLWDKVDDWLNPSASKTA